MKPSKKSNVYLNQLAVDLCKFSSENKVGLWRTVAETLMKPTRAKPLVNVFELDLHSKDGEVILVAGKVLGTGDINHKVTVAAFSFSKSAVEKITKAKGNVMTIQELVQKNPKAKDVRLFA